MCMWFIFLEMQMRINKSKIKHLDKFENAAAELIENLENLEKIDRSKDYNENKYRYGKPPYKILSIGEFYYRNTILEESKTDLKKVANLWEQELVEGEFHSIQVYTDSIIIFKIKEIENLITYVNHFLIYGPTNKLEKIIEEKPKKRKIQLEENWIYVSRRRLNYITN